MRGLKIEGDDFVKDKGIKQLREIRKKCIDCSAGSPKEIRTCLIVDCPLYPYRFGKNPKRKGIGRNSFGTEVLLVFKIPCSTQDFEDLRVILMKDTQE